ncbi:MAG TPA: hypothetical protein VF546_08350 [Pyrinomonadaceae bacterium]
MSGKLSDAKSCRSCPPPAAQRIYAPTIGTPEAGGSEIVLNSRSPEPLEITPTFYTAEGVAVVGQPVQLQPAEIRFVDIRSLIPPKHRGRHRWGGMAIDYAGGVLEAWAQLALLGVGKGGSVDVTFSILGDRRSDVQEAVWWTPARATSVIALGNSSGAAVSARLEYDNGETQSVEVAPFATEYVRRRAGAANGAQALTGGFGESVKIITAGPAGSLRAAGFVTADERRFASSIRFYDPRTIVQPNLYATKFRVQNAVEPHLLLKNISDGPLTVTPRFLPLSGEAGAPLELPPTTLAGHELAELDLTPLLAAAAARTELDLVSVQILNSGAPASLIGALCSSDATAPVTYDVPLRDTGASRNGTGSYPWRVDDDYNTVVSITNVSAGPAKFHVNIRYAGGSYDLKPRELAAGATATFDLRALLDDAAPDVHGEALPRAVTSGQFHWSVYGGGADVPSLIGRSEVVSPSRHISSSYSCPTCCRDSGPYGSFNPNAVTLLIDGVEQVGLAGSMSDCNGNSWQLGDIMGETTLSVQDSSVLAWASGQYGLTGMGVGSSDYYATWQLTEWTSDGMDCYVVYYNAGDTGQAGIDRLRVRSTSTIAADSSATSTAIVANEALPIFVEAVDANGLVDTANNSLVTFSTPTRTLDSSETGFPASFHLSGGSFSRNVLLNRVVGTGAGTTFRFRPSAGGNLDYFFYTYFRVLASREGLVGGTTSCSHVISANDHFVALPAAVQCSTGVTLLNGTTLVNTTVLDKGPWFPNSTASTGNPCVGGDDPYWNTGGVPRVLGTNCDSNNAAIDLADGTFSDLGLSGTSSILWRFR